MTNRKLLLAFLSVFTSSVMLADTQSNNDTKKTLSILNSELGRRECRFLTYSCEENFMPECILIGEYLLKAKQFQAEKDNIYVLTKQLANIENPICKKPVEQDLKKAKENCPNFEKLYWNTLTAEQQESIANAVANIVRSKNNSYSYSDSMNAVHKALNK